MKKFFKAIPHCVETSSSSIKASIITTSSLPTKAPSVSKDFQVGSDGNIEVYLKNLPSDPGLRPSILSYPSNLVEQVRRAYLLKGPCQPREHEFPQSQDGNRKPTPPVSAAPKEKQQKQERDEDEDEPKRKEKRPRVGNSAFLAPVKLSEALMKFLGTGESELPRSDVIKRIWDYIKLNNLQDPADKRQILCDEKLKELFNVDTFHGFSVAKHLTAHLIKIEQ